MPITVLVITTPSAENGLSNFYASVSEALGSIESGVNIALENSDIVAEIEIVGNMPIQHNIALLGDKQTLEDLYKGKGAFGWVASTRDTLKADIVILIGQMVTDCGLAANTSVGPDNAYAIVDWRCSDMSRSPLAKHPRELLIRQRTQLSNTIRGLIGEFGYIVRKGLNHIRDFAGALQSGDTPLLPEVAQSIIITLCDQLLDLDCRIKAVEKEIFSAARKDKRVKLLETIPGIGPVNASAIVATIGSGEQFSTGRDFAAWIGLTPINKSSGGKERLGRISRMGNQYLRKLLVAGMTARLRAALSHPEKVDPWTASILARKPARLATVAMANKTARTIWAVLSRNEPYKQPAAA